MADTDPSAAAPQGPQIQVLRQYIKDLSFENPNAPQTLRANKKAPQINFNVDVGVRKIEDGLHEVSLRMEARAQMEDDVAFICELVYAGLFGFQNIEEKDLPPFLLIEAPRILFPFARKIVADMTSEGGYPPIMLDPIDFAALYRQRLAQQAAQSTEGVQGADQPAGEVDGDGADEKA